MTSVSGNACRRCFVSGRVQGVFFRASTARQARALGITGHALNLDDGRVEVLAVGPAEALDALCEWLAAGPPAARVDDLAIRDEPVPDPAPGAFTCG